MPATALAAAVAALVIFAPALAVPPAAAQKAPVSLDTVHQRDQELESVRTEQKKAIEAEKRLRGEIEAIGEDRRKLNQALIDTAYRIRAVETRIAGTEKRLAELQATEGGIRASLDGRRAVIAEVLAALQRIGRRAPPAMMVKPEDALESVRTAMLLGAVLPQMRREADALAADLAEMVRLRAEIAGERTNLAGDLAGLSAEKDRMGLLVAERQRRQADAEKAAEGERARAAQLARAADNLKDLIARLEHGLDSAGRAARKAELAEARSDLAVLRDPGRLAPAVAFASAKGLLPTPVNGIRLKDYGAPDGTGGSEKGVSIVTRAGAQVTSPCDGWVVYAAPYRSYGQLLILNAGGGYHVVLAGMERISVDLGQFVLTGEPVAVMGAGPQVASAVATGMPGANQPILYIEFRKDGSPVDPTPWWATTDSEKVRG